MAGPFTALVLAGRRAEGDPVAAAAGAQVKALVPVAGMPMLARVLDTLAASPWIGRIAISAPDSAALAPALGGTPGLPLRFLPAGASPVQSVLAAMEELDDGLPLLITTSDHPLLDAAMIDSFCAAAVTGDGDLAVALACAAEVRARYPGAVRTVLRFRDGGYCGCNMFAVLRPEAVAAVRFWRQVESRRKAPWRLARAFGPLMLARFLLGRLTLTQAVALAGARLGVTARAVVLPHPEAAIDVDTAADLVLAEQILLGRHG